MGGWGFSRTWRGGGIRGLGQSRSCPAAPLGCAGVGGLLFLPPSQTSGRQSCRDRDAQIDKVLQKEQVETESGKDTQTKIDAEKEKKRKIIIKRALIDYLLCARDCASHCCFIGSSSQPCLTDWYDSVPTDHKQVERKATTCNLMLALKVPGLPCCLGDAGPEVPGSCRAEC